MPTTQDILDYTAPGRQDPKDFVASTGKRFANFILDRIFFYIFLFVLSFLFGTSINDGSGDISTFFVLILLLSIPGYWVLFEYFLGKTPAKYITQTKVVTNKGNKPSFLNIVGRTLCRFIPFEPFSFLASSIGWHDSISGTLVVEEGYEKGVGEFV